MIGILPRAIATLALLVVAPASANTAPGNNTAAKGNRIVPDPATPANGSDTVEVLNDLATVEADPTANGAVVEADSDGAPQAPGIGYVALLSSALLAAIAGAALAVWMVGGRISRLTSELEGIRTRVDGKHQDFAARLETTNQRIDDLKRPARIAEPPPIRVVPEPAADLAPFEPEWLRAPVSPPPPASFSDPVWEKPAAPIATDSIISELRDLFVDHALSDSGYNTRLAHFGTLRNVVADAGGGLVLDGFVDGDPSQRLTAIAIDHQRLILVPSSHFAKEFAIIFKETLEAGRVVQAAYECRADGSGALSVLALATGRDLGDGRIVDLAKGVMGGFVR